MKKTPLAFSITLLFSLTLISNLLIAPVHAQTPQLVGTHLTVHNDPDTLSYVRGAYDRLYADWAPVVYMMSYTEASQADQVTEIANRFARYRLMPTFRIVSDYTGTWSVPTSSQALAAARGLAYGLARASLPRQAVVVVGNEVNMDSEWGGNANPVGYWEILRIFVENAGGNYLVANSPLNTSFHASEGYAAADFWNQLITHDQASGLNILNQLGALAFNSYALQGCADYSDCGRLSWLWEIQDILRPRGINTNKPKVLTEFGPDPNNRPSNYYQYHLTLLQNTQSDFLNNGVIAVTPLALDLCTDQDWAWLAIDSSLNTIVFYSYSGFRSIDDSCVFGSPPPFTQPPGTGTLPGSYLPDYPTEWGPAYCANEDCFCKRDYSLASCQDSSPFRPFPGQSDRRTNCLDLAEVERETELTVYCNPAPEVRETVLWFPIPTPGQTDQPITRSFLHPGDLKAIYFDGTQATQIPFLGNSSYSSREFINASQRMSLFLSDYLRGEVYWDRQPVDIYDRDDLRRIANESGPIRKLFPEEILRSDERREQFVDCRLGNSNDCDLLVSTDPIHDYTIGPLNRSVRLHQVNRNSEAWDHYFPLTSKEDVPVFVDLGVSTVWPIGSGVPFSPYFSAEQLIPGECGVPSSISAEDLYRVIDSAHPGYYYIALTNGDCSPRLSPISGTQLYEVHYVELMHIPHIAESKELSEWSAQPITPWAFQNPASPSFWEEDSTAHILYLDNPYFRHLYCNVNDIVRGGPGDTLSLDFRFCSNPAIRDSRLSFFNEWSATVPPSEEWACTLWNPPLTTEWPTREQTDFQRNDPNWPETPYTWITTKIPYLERLAKRTIGEAGLFRSFLPSSFFETVQDGIEEIANGRIGWYELPGYGPGNYEFSSPVLTREPDTQEHWGCCEADTPPMCNAGDATGCHEDHCGAHCEDPNDPTTCWRELYRVGTFCNTNTTPHCIETYIYCCPPELTDEQCWFANNWPRRITAGIDRCSTEMCGERNDCRCYNTTQGAPVTGCYFTNPANPFPDDCDEFRNDTTCEWEEMPCDACDVNDPVCQCACDQDNCGPTLAANGLDYRGWGETSNADARFYYPYIGAIDLFRQYTLNQMSPHQLSSFYGVRPPPAATGPTPTPLPPPGPITGPDPILTNPVTPVEGTPPPLGGNTAHVKIGLHVGPGGNRTGFGDYLRTLANAGVRAVVKSVEDYGALDETLRYNSQNIAIFRLTGGDLELPNYNNDPIDEAAIHWNNRIRPALEERAADYNGFDRRIWVEVMNEPDRNRSRWLARFAYEIARIANNQNYRIALFGWSSGEPESSDWQTPEMITFLQYAAANPDRVAVALHEYSYDVNDITNMYHYLIGRFQILFQACDSHSIPRPTVLITEWGWEYQDVPDPIPAMNDIHWAASLYAAYPQVRGAALWYLGPGFGGIAEQAQRLIAPLADYATSNYFTLNP